MNLGCEAPRRTSRAGQAVQPSSPLGGQGGTAVAPLQCVASLVYVVGQRSLAGSWCAVPRVRCKGSASRAMPRIPSGFPWLFVAAAWQRGQLAADAESARFRSLACRTRHSFTR